MKNRINELNKIYTRLDELTRLHGFSSDIYNELCLCLDEIFSNIIRYAYEDEDEHDIEIQFDFNKEASKLTIIVIDDGIMFNPLEARIPNMRGDLMDREVGGLGIFIVYNIMNSVEYSRTGRKNKLKMIKYIEDCDDVC